MTRLVQSLRSLLLKCVDLPRSDRWLCREFKSPDIVVKKVHFRYIISR